MIPNELKENEYLLKVRSDNNTDTGFMTKYNKNGSIPVAFSQWGRDLPTQLHVEEFNRGWKFISYRIGVSQSWATVMHPLGFTLEIYLSNLRLCSRYFSILQSSDYSFEDDALCLLN